MFALSINIIDNLFQSHRSSPMITLSFYVSLSLLFHHSTRTVSRVRNEIETITKPLSNFNQSNQTSETLLVLVQCQLLQSTVRETRQFLGIDTCSIWALFFISLNLRALEMSVRTRINRKTITSRRFYG